MYTYSLVEHPSGAIGFVIYCEGSPCITQDFMPDADGFVLMTEEQAIEQAEILIGRLQA